MRSRLCIAGERLLRCSTGSQCRPRRARSAFEQSVETRRLEQLTQRMPVFPAEFVAQAAAQVNEVDIDRLKAVDKVTTAMEWLQSMSHVRVGDAASTAAKLRQMAAFGARRLLVISDFDFTISRFADADGQRLSTTHGVFDDNAARIDPVLGKKFVDLRDRYYPIEFDPLLTVEEKIPHMEAWWRTSHNYIVESGFTRAMIDEFVRLSRVALRDGSEELMRDLERRRVPLVIFSAGIGNVIESFLQQKMGAVPSNAHLISNMILFDKNDKATAFSEPLIHTFCKNSSVIQKEASFFHDVSGRPNVILLGDSMGDIHMDVGVEKNGPTLRIGFFNGDVNDEALLDHYVEAYDIVLIHDSTMTIPQRVVDIVG